MKENLKNEKKQAKILEFYGKMKSRRILGKIFSNWIELKQKKEIKQKSLKNLFNILNFYSQTMKSQAFNHLILDIEYKKIIDQTEQILVSLFFIYYFLKLLYLKLKFKLLKIVKKQQKFGE